MAQSVHIDGLEDALRCFELAPKNMIKVVKAAMREGGKEAAKEIRKAMPRRFKRLVTHKVKKNRVTGNWDATVGAFNKVKGSGKERDDWFKAYWKNYGTLSRRDPGHKFDNPIKNLHKKRRNEVGQQAENFYDEAILPAKEAFFRAFSESVKAQEDKLKER